MHFVIVGAGAVGGYFGGRLAQSGEEVTFLVRERRMEDLKRAGLTVRSVHGDFSISPQLSTDARKVKAPDVVVVCTKNYHLPSIMPQLQILVERGARLLPLLNGTKHLELFTREFGENAVLGGLCYIESTLNERGEVIHTSAMQDIVFGRLNGKNGSFEQSIEQHFKDAAINVTLTNKIIEQMWVKYIFLTALSGITTAIRQPIGVVLGDAVTRDFLDQLLDELCTVARRTVPSLTEDLKERLHQRLSSIAPSMTSSMHRDLEKGSPMELNSLHGAFIDYATAVHVEVPNLKAIYAMLHPYVDGPCALTPLID